MNNLYWRNTKESIKNEYTIPPLVEDLVLLEFTQIEQLLYQDCANCLPIDEQSQICSHPSIPPVYNSLFGNAPVLSELKDDLIKHIKHKIVQNEKDIKNWEAEIPAARKKLEKAKSLPDLKNELNSEKDSLNKLKRKHDWEKVKDLVYEPKDEPKFYEKIRNLENEVLSLTKKVSELEANIALWTERIQENPNKIEHARKLIELDNISLKNLNKLVHQKYSGPDMSKELNFPNETEEESKVDAEEGKEKESETNGNGNEEKEAEEEEEDLAWSEILEMTVATLKEELISRGITPNHKQKKAQLQKVLKDAVKNKMKSSKPTTGAKKRKLTAGSGAPSKKIKAAPKDESEAPKRTTQDKLKEQQFLKWLVEIHGTKMGNFILYMKKLWTDNPNAKLIIFSQFDALLEKISQLFTEHNVDHAFVEGSSVQRRKKVAEFRSQESTRALLLNIRSAASGLNIIEATHIILMEPLQGDDAKATEAQAIGRAHRQGQTSQVTVVRFVVKDTIEYNAHVQHYGLINKEAVPEEEGGDSSQSTFRKPQRTQSFTTSLVLPTGSSLESGLEF
eukprot:Phypoly_transcript_06132.p1 GENE.Phypoly_transcript_06132~~Phypoly_transcript_06132.p1  ORF type:complete len:588 (+),score=154.11 Phypoly_transcript_06132:77-1765(+)